jgi:hypothetical protein
MQCARRHTDCDAHPSDTYANADANSDSDSEHYADTYGNSAVSAL